MASWSGPPDFSKIPVDTPPPGVRSNFVNPPSIIWQMIFAQLLGNVLAVTSLSLRLNTRLRILKKFAFDDALLIIATILGVIISGVGNLMGKYGFGVHGWNVPLSHLPDFLRLNFIATLNYIVVLTLVKLAILGFLNRINTQQYLRYITWALAFVVFGNALGAIISLLLRCEQVPELWNKLGETHCHNTEPIWFLATGEVNILTDFSMLILPIPMLWKLTLPFRQKIGVVIVLMTGSMVMFFSIARLVVLLPAFHRPDQTYTFIKVGVLSHLETQVAIVCACLPSLKPLFKKSQPAEPVPDPESPIEETYTQFSMQNQNVFKNVEAEGKVILVPVR